MLKIVCLIRKRPDLSIEDFRHYYENHHAPMMQHLLPMMRRYTRNYPDLDGARLPEGVDWLGFDVMTEAWFDSDEDYRAYLARLAEPDVLAVVRRDEHAFVVPEMVMRFRVEETTTMGVEG